MSAPAHDPDDAVLIAAVLRGETQQFGELVRRHQKAIAIYLWNLLTHHHDCEELVQESFLQAYRKLNDFDPKRASFRTWLVVIARNRAFNAVAKKTPGLLAELPESPEHVDPSASLASVEWRECFDAALDELSLDQRSAFVLAEIQGLPYAEIAQIEAVKIGTVKSRVARAKAALRARVPRTI